MRISTYCVYCIRPLRYCLSLLLLLLLLMFMFPFVWVWFQLGVVSYTSSPRLSVCVYRKEGRVGEGKEEGCVC